MLLHIYGTILLCGDDSGGLTDGEHIQLVSVRDDVADIVHSLSMEINELFKLHNHKIQHSQIFFLNHPL